mgnify:CR=1 FL=1
MKKTINIGVYFSKLTVIVTKDFKSVLKEYGLKDSVDTSKFGAFTFKDERKYRHYVMVLEDDWRVNVVHELVHVVNHIYVDCNMKLDKLNDEPQAYLMCHLFEEIDNFLNNNKKNEKRTR